MVTEKNWASQTKQRVTLPDKVALNTTNSHRNTCLVAKRQMNKIKTVRSKTGSNMLEVDILQMDGII